MPDSLYLVLVIAALNLARQHHSLREIAPYAGMTFSGVAHLTQTKEKN